ncbi:MAG TPA: hypothetical protein PLK30_25615 [Blastocatellia bacterium]|nr:hypothetical protein [Blastocatellia bacterium]
MKTICHCLLLAGFLFISTEAFAQSAKQAKSSHPAKNKQAAPTAEGFYFLMNDYKLDHQGEINTLNIKLSYQYNTNIADNQYPDFIPIRKDVDKFLTEYPNEMTFWEIVNKQLTAMILEKYPALASVTCEIQVTPSPKYPFTRGSIVTRRRTRLAEAPSARQNSRRAQ